MQSVKIIYYDNQIERNIFKYIIKNIFKWLTSWLFLHIITISVTPFPAKLSARSLVSLLSLYGMCTPLSDRFWELSCAIQYPNTIKLLFMLLASVNSFPSLFVFFVISDLDIKKRWFCIVTS